MPDTTLTLVSAHLCPYVQRAAITLLEKGVPFERVYIDLKAKPDWFLKISPLGRVPLLRVSRPGHPDVVLFESSVISEFIDETQKGPKLHPSDPVERALHRAWMEFGSSLLADLYAIQTAKDAETFQAKAKLFTEKVARVAETLSATGPFFAGEAFSLVDAVFAPAFRIVAAMATIVGVDLLPPLPRIAAWRDALLARPSVVAAVPDDYLARMEAFLRSQDGYLLARAA
ncbi:MAG: glutathione S-transferase family protein [Bauldia sp.]|nr:glutathione S-transferase family protein [Bauldia sp.]